MILVILLGIFGMFFAWLEGTGNFKHGLKTSFGLIFLFLALRYNYGSDYPTYLSFFQEVNNFSDIGFFDKSLKIEPGWVFLNWLCKPIGFFGMMAVLALLNCYIYYKFIKKYVPNKYYWFAVFLYVFDSSYMLIHSTAMRQNVAVLLFIFALDYLYKKDFIRYVICIVIASFFHYSALILLPLYFLGLINFKINFKLGFLIIISFLILFSFSDMIFPQVQSIINQYFDKYSVYDNFQKVKAGYGIFLNSFIFILIIYFSKFQDTKNLLLFKIGMFNFIIIPMVLLIQIFSRLGMYFQPALLVIYPLIFLQIKIIPLKYAFMLILIIFTIFTFKLFFESPIWSQSFTDYQTIFSAPGWY